jgi:hypothetical protein
MKQTKNLKIMKTIIQSITVSAAIYSILFILIASIAFGSELNFNTAPDSTFTPQEIAFEEESYIDDIPFDTRSIADNYLLDESISTNFDFEAEAYIDDIPFDTKKIALAYTSQYASAK